MLARPAMKLRRLMGVALRPSNTLAQHGYGAVRNGKRADAIPMSAMCPIADSCTAAM